ncbi:MAG: proline racemase family protein [Thermodesulfobacteriota bacterium]|nr:proline racemase family protein [Thermodesulfobacteriota bacterium]
MDFTSISNALSNRFTSRLVTIDSHTAGEPTRLIIKCVGPVPGRTMKEKYRYFIDNLDHIRLQLTKEPRGHRDMMAALVTEPTTDGADFGLIYMDARRYPFLCGHATIGAVTTLIETGILQPSDTMEATVIVDTPSGAIETRAFIDNGKVESVAIQMVPSFVYSTNETLHVPDLGEIFVDTVCVGGFFAMISADQIGLELIPKNGPKLIELGMTIIDMANQQLEVRHPVRPEVTTVDVAEFYDPSEHDRGLGKNVVIYGEAHMDRSPCGTGTAAKMTLLHHHGQMGLNQPFRNFGPLESAFDARIVKEATIGNLYSVIVEIRGSAHITGIHEFILDTQDPFPKGFLI